MTNVCSKTLRWRSGSPIGIDCTKRPCSAISHHSPLSPEFVSPNAGHSPRHLPRQLLPPEKYHHRHPQKCPLTIGGDRSFRQKWGYGAVPAVKYRKKAPGGDLRASPPEAYDTFCGNMSFCHSFQNDIAIFAFIAYKCSIGNERKSIWKQSSYRASNSACILRRKLADCPSALPNRLRRQCP